ncbi:MAG: hypothetical protein K9J17_08550 [Flavobacteriales bacterium]|nr:hypothetical protein [Flavobacteriales bacterium]
MKYSIKFIQSELTKQGYNPGGIDGVLGRNTLGALERIPSLAKEWSTERKLVGFIQLTAQKENIEVGKIDGLWGPQTSYAYDCLLELRKHGAVPVFRRPCDEVDVNPNDWPSEKPQQNIIDFYGEVGKNQTSVEVAYPHILDWDRDVSTTKITCHQKVGDSLVRVLSKVKDHYGMDGIHRLKLDIWGGGFNVRKKRGGSEYSMHSWGIAMDYDPSNNKLNWGSDRASFAQPDYNKWWELWEEEGWLSLGRARNFDWMHVQAAKL